VAELNPVAQDVVRLPLDLRAERAIARLRVSAALMVALASGWLLALPYPLPRLFALAGFGFALLWFVRAARMRRQIRGAADHYLELARDALRLREGERSERVPWSEVESISVDEDRLLLRVARRRGPSRSSPATAAWACTSCSKPSAALGSGRMAAEGALRPRMVKIGQDVRAQPVGNRDHHPDPNQDRTQAQEAAAVQGPAAQR
jgi:hypothetical protein